MTVLDPIQIDQIARQIFFTNNDGVIIENKEGKPFSEIAYAETIYEHGFYTYYSIGEEAAVYFLIQEWQTRLFATVEATKKQNPDTADELQLMEGGLYGLQRIVSYLRGPAYSSVEIQPMHFAIQARVRELHEEYGISEEDAIDSIQIQRNRGGFKVKINDPRYNDLLLEGKKIVGLRPPSTSSVDR